jgi:hypothetical protein
MMTLLKKTESLPAVGGGKAFVVLCGLADGGA